jgi:hypothetical protein
MALFELPQVELELVDEETKDDLYTHSKQRIAVSGRILVSKKAWVLRGAMLAGLVV